MSSIALKTTITVSYGAIVFKMKETLEFFNYLRKAAFSHFESDFIIIWSLHLYVIYNCDFDSIELKQKFDKQFQNLFLINAVFTTGWVPFTRIPHILVSELEMLHLWNIFK